GAVLNAALLFLAVLFPSTLGPTYQLARARAEPEQTVPRAVPLPGTAPAAGGEATAEWTDASRYSLQIKKVRVQVVSATVRLFEAPAAGVELRLEIPAETWGGTGVLRFAIPASMRDGSAATVKEKGK